METKNLWEKIKEKTQKAVEDTSSKMKTITEKTAPDKFQYLKEKTNILTSSGKNKFIDASVATKDKIEKLKYTGQQFSEKLQDAMPAKVQSLKNGANAAYARSREYVNNFYKSTIETDKDTAQIIDEIKEKQPRPAKDFNSLLAECKRESFKNAIMIFGLTPQMFDTLDDELYNDFNDLHQAYKDVDSNELQRHENFKEKQDARNNAKEAGSTLTDEFDSTRENQASETDIDHIIPKEEVYNNILLRAGTTHEELKDVINTEKNLAFTFASLNRSKNDRDFKEYLENRGVPDPEDPNILHIDVNGKDITVNKEEALGHYNEAKEKLSEAELEAMEELVGNALGMGVRMAIRQAIGIIIISFYDIFFDEIKDIIDSGIAKDNDSFYNAISDRSIAMTEKLNKRIEEEQVIKKLKQQGLDSFVSGTVSMIPMILISLLIELPSYILRIIRESTLCVVRGVRVFVTEREDKFHKIQLVMYDGMWGIIGALVAVVVASTVIDIPGLNVFTPEITAVISGCFVGIGAILAIYYFEQFKSKMLFSRIKAKPVNV